MEVNLTVIFRALRVATKPIFYICTVEHLLDFKPPIKHILLVFCTKRRTLYYYYKVRCLIRCTSGLQKNAKD